MIKTNILLLSGLILTFMVSCSHKDSKSDLSDSAEKETTLAKANGDKEPLNYACKVKDDIRIVKMDKQSSRCEVFYTKFGEESQVGWAEATPSLCDRVYGQIRTNIEEKGFKCSEDIAQFKKELKNASK